MIGKIINVEIDLPPTITMVAASSKIVVVLKSVHQGAYVRSTEARDEYFKANQANIIQIYEGSKLILPIE